MEKALTINEIRKKLIGKNYAEIARQIGVTRSYVQYLATNDNAKPGYDVLIKLSGALQND